MQRLVSTGEQAAKYHALGGTVGQFTNQSIQIGGGAIGMHQGGMHSRIGVLAGQRRAPVKGAHGVRGHVAQHHRQRGLVPVFNLGGQDAHPCGTGPMRHVGKGLAQTSHQGWGLAGEAVGDVNQPQRRGGPMLQAVLGQHHVGAQLGHHQAKRHVPLRVNGVGVYKHARETAG